MEHLSCFKSYDIRGELGHELNEDIAYRIGYAYAQFLHSKKVVIGSDIRLSSEALKAALAQGIMDAGSDVIDIGMTGTEEVYFATFHLGVDGGIQITASHNPSHYNGMKLVRRDAVPISSDSGLLEIKKLAETGQFQPAAQKGQLTRVSIEADYIQHLKSYIDLSVLKPLTLVVNAGNGAAGHVIDALEAQFKQAQIPITFIKIHHEPNGHFPNGIPNPLLPENRLATIQAVLDNQADLGIAWDGDFDRCFFFDSEGKFIEGYYIVGLLAEYMLKKSPGESIIHDPRLVWNTIDKVKHAGGIPIICKTGHAFIKERMRLENALYGGEMSGHHYFRQFNYCDSGMIPWLLVVEMLSSTGQSLSGLIKNQMDAYPCSGELNYTVLDAKDVLQKVTQHFEILEPKLCHVDGVSFEFENVRFNLRSSNTEPLLRLNVEARQDAWLVQEMVDVLEKLIQHSHEKQSISKTAAPAIEEGVI